MICISVYFWGTFGYFLYKFCIIFGYIVFITFGILDEIGINVRIENCTHKNFESRIEFWYFVK